MSVVEDGEAVVVDGGNGNEDDHEVGTDLFYCWRRR